MKRIERDSIGEVEVPDDRYWGAQTERSRLNFQIGREKIPIEVVHALVLIKKAASSVNQHLNLLPADKAKIIQEVCDEVLKGGYDDHFPLSVWQTGSGTQSNMNVNEVVANLANEKLGQPLGSKSPIHPNDDVNKSQSSNDVFPTAMHISSFRMIKHQLLPNLNILAESLDKKAKAFSGIIKVGRTHLMDATPMTLGQEFSGYVSQIRHGIETLEGSLKHLAELAVGGTAVGTGLNAPEGFGEMVTNELKRLTGLPFVSAANKFEALAANDAIVEVSGALRRLACSFLKIANDIRWLASGPRAGLREITIPANEPGSSIMPGKVNPTQSEAMSMVAVQVIGNDEVIAIAGSQGNFELNVYKPVMIYNLIQSIHLLSDVSLSFAKKCVDGIEPNLKTIHEYVDRSLMHATALNLEIGYDKASQVVKKAYEEDISLKQAALQLNFLTAERFDEVVDPKKMV